MAQRIPRCTHALTLARSLARTHARTSSETDIVSSSAGQSPAPLQASLRSCFCGADAFERPISVLGAGAFGEVRRCRCEFFGPRDVAIKRIVLTGDRARADTECRVVQELGGRNRCCSRCCCGIQGCKTWVTGCNLDNLCAEGGLPGKTCCYAFWGTEFRCQDKVSFDGCGGWSLHTDCACAYGGDFMAGGKPSSFRIYNTSNNCFAKAIMAVPYGLIANGPTYVTHNYRGNACQMEHTMCGGTTPYAFSANCGGRSGIPGRGAPSATSCAGGCCYGRGGASGMIKITYCSCWIHGSDRNSTGNENCACYFFN